MEIAPLRGVLYNQEKVNIDDIVAPPYDVISPEQQARLYDRNPYNVVRLILGREEDRYTSAARHLSDWLRAGILVRDEKPAVYLLTQSFDEDQGKTIVRKGFIALCRLVGFEERVVLPHEKTLAKPREDRFKLFKATNSNFSQIFSLYSDPEKQVDRLLNGYLQGPPVVDVMFENVQNRLWRLQDAEKIRQLREIMSPKQALIADGHHRYETALAYRDYCRAHNPRHTGNEPYNYVMMFFTNVDDEGLVIYPTHRLVHSLNGLMVKDFLERMSQHFLLREFKDNDALLKALQSTSVRSFGMKFKGEPTSYLATLKPTITAAQVVHDDLPKEVRELDVTLLHSLVLRDLLGISVEAQEQKVNIDYVKSAPEAFAAVESGTAQMAFLMNPTKIQEVRNVAKAGYTMPQKSTYFYPKLLSGLVINLLSD